MAIIDSLVAKLSFDFDEKKLKKFNKGMKDAGKMVAKVAGVATVAGGAIFAMTNKIAGQNDETYKLSKTIGVTAQSLNELGHVANLNGASVESMNSSLENLSKVSSEASMGMGAGVEAFGRLGVSVMDANGQLKGTDSLMLDVADAVGKLDNQSQKLELLSKLGIGSDMLLTLEQGSEAIREQRKELKELGFVLDKDALKSAEDFNDEMARVGIAVKGVASAIGTKLMKIITPMIQGFLKWYKANKEIIKQNLTAFFEKAVKVIKAIFTVITRVASAINTIVQAFGGWKVALIGIIGLITALNARVLLVPMLIGALLTGLALLAEDMVKYFQGGDSQLGKLAEKSKTFKAVLDGIIGVLKQVADGWNLVFTQGDKALGGLKILVNDLIGALNKIPFVDISKIGGTPGVAKARTAQITQADIASARSRGMTEQQIASIVQQAGGQSALAPNVTINVDGGNPAEIRKELDNYFGSKLKTAQDNVSSNVVN